MTDISSIDLEESDIHYTDQKENNENKAMKKTTKVKSQEKPQKRSGKEISKKEKKEIK